MDDPIHVPGLLEACEELAHVVLAANQPHVSRDILETLAAKFEREAADFAPLVASNGRDTALLARAVHYLLDAHALPLMGTDMEWFRQALACVVELAVPGIALSPKGAAFLNDVQVGISQSLQDLE
jgi:molybdopterin-guanine dinucleotide biosynthesis protein A